MRIKDDVAAGIRLCTLTQAIRCSATGSTSVKAVTGSWVPADRGDSRGRCSGRAGVGSGSCAPASAHRLAVNGQAGVAAARAAGVHIEILTRVQPASAAARVGVASGEDDKVAGGGGGGGGWGVAVVPAGGSAVDGDGELWAWVYIVAETGDEGSCAAWCRGGGSGRRSGGSGRFSKDCRSTE